MAWLQPLLQSADGSGEDSAQFAQRLDGPVSIFGPSAAIVRIDRVLNFQLGGQLSRDRKGTLARWAHNCRRSTMNRTSRRRDSATSWHFSHRPCIVGLKLRFRAESTASADRVRGRSGQRQVVGVVTHGIKVVRVELVVP